MEKMTTPLHSIVILMMVLMMMSISRPVTGLTIVDKTGPGAADVRFKPRIHERREAEGDRTVVERGRQERTQAGLRAGLTSYVDSGYLTTTDVDKLPQILADLAPLMMRDGGGRGDEELAGLSRIGRRAGHPDHQAAPSARLHDSVADLLAASDLGIRQLGNAGRDDLASCLTQIILLGGLPAGFNCVGIAGKTSSGIRSLINLSLEQFLGIFTTKVIEEILDVIDDSLSGLVPSDYEHDLVPIIHAAFLSVAASLTGNGVTALERTEECISIVFQTGDMRAFSGCIFGGESMLGRGGVYEVLEAGLDGVLEQMVGVLGPSELSQVENLVRFHLSNTPLASLPLQLVQSLHALLAILGPGSVTSFEKLQLALAPLLSQLLLRSLPSSSPALSSSKLVPA
ncbi:hypothetical protein PGT21_017605 [Puccinia graminis f. sp. tritici]|nr:hypothetical protein PGT21_017605 [Puccinia graminis f. sp. tritici]